MIEVLRKNRVCSHVVSIDFCDRNILSISKKSYEKYSYVKIFYRFQKKHKIILKNNFMGFEIIEISFLLRA